MDIFNRSMTIRDEASMPTVFRKKLPPHLDKIKHGHYTPEDKDYAIHLHLKENDIRVDETGSEVVDFLRKKSILVTGGTGFIGKLLIEKLLRCCKDIGTIYVIVRTKKGKEIESRMKEFLDHWVFIKLSEIYPDYRKKVVGISGDFEEDSLGLSDDSRKILTENVDIIYHVAATVRFDEKLKRAIQINIKGTREVIKIAKECKRLQVLTHVSTAYSNCHHKEIKEEFYPPFMDYRELIELTDRLSSDVVDKITPGLLDSCPNTYTFTKQISEDLVRRECVGIPTCIQRPSIVTASVREPIRSWVDNLFGPVGFLIAIGMGVIHVTWADPNARCDMVPVDYVINNCIVASYKTAKDRITDKVQIYNFTSSDDNPLYWKQLNGLAKQGMKVCSSLQMMVYFIAITKNWYWYRFLHFIFHKVPGHIVDFVLVRLGKQPILTKAYDKMSRFVTILSYFTLNEWKFVYANTSDLWTSLNEQDKKIFAFDMSSLDWQDYFDTSVTSSKELLLNDYLDKLDEGRLHHKRLHTVFFLFLSLVLTLTTYITWNTIFFVLPIFIVFLTVYLTYISYFQ